MLNFKKEASFPVLQKMRTPTRSMRRNKAACWQSGAAPAAVKPLPLHGSQSTLQASAETRSFSSVICPLPCCPASARPEDLENKGSLGSVLAAAHVSESLIKNNLATHKRLGYLSLLGADEG